MNVLFLTMVNVDVNNRGIYNDLMRKFRNEGHKVYIVCPVERRSGNKTYLSKEDNVFTLHVRTLNLQKTNIIEKGIGQLLLEPTFKIALKRHFGDVRFDLILYSTPPITFNNVIQYAKSSSGNNALSPRMPWIWECLERLESRASCTECLEERKRNCMLFLMLLAV